MSTGRIIWLCAMVFDLLLFFFIIPVDVYDHHWLLYSALGAVIFGGCLFLFLGDYSSTYELFEKEEPGTPQTDSRRAAPFAVIPTIILLIILIFYHSDQKDKELSDYPVITKGSVYNGESTTTRRNFSSNTTYSIDIKYRDSMNRQHIFEQSVDGSQFRNMYKGAVVDVVYSQKHPALAKALLDLDDLSEIKKIPQGKISVAHLLSIMEGDVKEDSVLQYLNSINYEWTTSKEEGFYENNKMQIAIKVFPGEKEIAFVQKRNLFVVRNGDGDFEENITKEGFKKKASSANGVTNVLYYTDRYTLTKEIQKQEYKPNNGVSMDVLEIFRLARVN